MSNLRTERRALVAKIAHSRSLARHATWTALAAVSIDWAYTATFWLVLGRPHRARRYFPIVGQLSVETAAIVYLIGQLRKVEKDA